MRILVETDIGSIGVEGDGTAVTRLHFPGFVPEDFSSSSAPSAVLLRAAEEIRGYMEGGLTEFSIPLRPAGTEFMRAVWDRLVRIGYGELMTNGEVAEAVGSPGGSRAVGMACRGNPIPLIIPCHRVIGANGKLTGFSGGGLEVKRWLLELECPGRFDAEGLKKDRYTGTLF